jgi:hypothetical protein
MNKFSFEHEMWRINTHTTTSGHRKVRSDRLHLAPAVGLSGRLGFCCADLVCPSSLALKSMQEDQFDGCPLQCTWISDPLSSLPRGGLVEHPKVANAFSRNRTPLVHRVIPVLK